ncbi:MAG: peptidylprolyl isomerase [Lachnospiraceae bacterium]|nr:peptidylprolyl isomerase [Lachnospiraceae bacterium]
MKRYLTFLMSVIMILTLFAGCQSNEEESVKDTTSEATTTEAAAEEASTAALTLDKKVDIKTPKTVDQTSEPEEGETVAILHIKDYGDISMKFFYEDSPLAVENFLTLAVNGYYDGVTFHRVIQDFMIQGGDPDGTGMGGTSIWGEPFANEYSERLAQINGSVAMARTQELDTNESQFFINDNTQEITDDALAQYDLSDSIAEMFKTYGGNPYLQGQYTVFAQVYDGMDVVDAISATATDTNDMPVEDIVIESIDVTEYSK